MSTRGSLHPADDWMSLGQLAELLGIGLSTASRWHRRGDFVRYEHGFRPCGRRRFSRSLIEAELRRTATRSCVTETPPQRTSRVATPAASTVDRVRVPAAVVGNTQDESEGTDVRVS